VKGHNDAEHLFRLVAVFAAGIVIFLALRGSLVPRSFGQYGPYRGDALGEIASRPISYAGYQVCETCHSDVSELKHTGKHAHVNCEACHGPLAKHADDPASVVPVKPDPAKLCVRCHEANQAKPRSFPQIVAAEHAGDVNCRQCHRPHHPDFGSGAGK